MSNTATTAVAQGATFGDTAAPGGGAPPPLMETLYLDWLYYKSNPGLQAFIAQNYSEYAWMMSNNELGPIVVATALGGLSADQQAAALTQSQWWKTNGRSVAEWQDLQATDPSTAARQVADMKNTILADANAAGVALSDQQMTDLATKAKEFAWDSTTITQNVKDMVTQGATPGTYNFAATGTAAKFRNDLEQHLQQWAVPVSDDVKNYWTALAVQGRGDINGVVNYLRTQAEQLYPWMSSALKQGITPAQYLSPYSSIASNLLGVDASAIDWTDPKWQSAVAPRGPDGTSVPASTQSFATTLRSDPVFGYSKTPTAIANAYSMAQQIEQSFGKVKV